MRQLTRLPEEIKIKKSLLEKYPEEALLYGWTSIPNVVIATQKELKLTRNLLWFYVMVKMFHPMQYINHHDFQEMNDISEETLRKYRRKLGELKTIAGKPYLTTKQRIDIASDGSLYTIGMHYNWENMEMEAYRIFCAQSTDPTEVTVETTKVTVETTEVTVETTNLTTPREKTCTLYKDNIKDNTKDKEEDNVIYNSYLASQDKKNYGYDIPSGDSKEYSLESTCISSTNEKLIINNNTGKKFSKSSRLGFLPEVLRETALSMMKNEIHDYSHDHIIDKVLPPIIEKYSLDKLIAGLYTIHNDLTSGKVEYYNRQYLIRAITNDTDVVIDLLEDRLKYICQCGNYWLAGEEGHECNNCGRWQDWTVVEQAIDPRHSGEKGELILYERVRDDECLEIYKWDYKCSFCGHVLTDYYGCSSVKCQRCEASLHFDAKKIEETIANIMRSNGEEIVSNRFLGKV